MALELIVDEGQMRKYRLDDQRLITIKIDDFFEHIFVFDDRGGEIGRIELSEISDEMYTSYYIKWMYLDLKDSLYKRKGIGRECLVFFKDLTRAPITASCDDGIPKDDGSHLTGDAPGFVSKMREEGIIEQITY